MTGSDLFFLTYGIMLFLSNNSNSWWWIVWRFSKSNRATINPENCDNRHADPWKNSYSSWKDY